MLIVLSCLFLFAGCKMKQPGSVIPEDEMENLLYDYHIAKSMGDNLPYNEGYKKKLFLDFVFQKYGTTEARFDSSLVWYTRNTEMLSDIYERVNKRLKAEQGKIATLISKRDNKPKTSKPGDSIDVWAWQRFHRLSGSPLTNKLTFTLPSDTNFQARDTLVWTANYHFLPADPDTAYAVLMEMRIEYENDTVNSLKRIFQSGLHSIQLQADSTKDAKDIRDIKGFIYYPLTADRQSSLLVNGISLYRYHSKDSVSLEPTDSIARPDSVPEPVAPVRDAIPGELSPRRLRPSNDIRPVLIESVLDTIRLVE